MYRLWSLSYPGNNHDLNLVGSLGDFLGLSNSAAMKLPTGNPIPTKVIAATAI